jgi:hypothetical protein
MIKEALAKIESLQLVAVRNDLAHSLTRDETSYRDIYLQHEAAILGVVHALRGLLMADLVVVDSIEFIDNTDGPHFVIRGVRLVGSNPVFEPAEHQSTLAFPAGAVLILADDGRPPARLDPLIRWARCPTCGHHRVLLFDHGRTYLDPQEGHRVALMSSSN